MLLPHFPSPHFLLIDKISSKKMSFREAFPSLSECVKMMYFSIFPPTLRVPGSWNQDPGWAPCSVQSLLLPFLTPTPSPSSCSLSLSNKFKKSIIKWSHQKYLLKKSRECISYSLERKTCSVKIGRESFCNFVASFCPLFFNSAMSQGFSSWTDQFCCAG